MSERHVIAAASGLAIRLHSGASARIELTEGPQVVDAWAFGLPDLSEFLSAEHTRSCLERLIPRRGDALYSNRRRPILRIIEDRSPGVHDLLLSACDDARYRLLGHAGPHRSCVANLREALHALGLAPPEIPSPFNIFERVGVSGDGVLEIQPPLARKGDSITLCAETDLVLVLSACPMDIAPTNGADRTPKGVSVEIFAAG
ncbi:MAG: urea carboxylase-associated family protein [Pseudomonadota bacterium]|nr:urea carboxylase-associated family protein [Pseudomonadota bacterium]